MTTKFYIGASTFVEIGEIKFFWEFGHFPKFRDLLMIVSNVYNYSIGTHDVTYNGNAHYLLGYERFYTRTIDL